MIKYFSKLFSKKQFLNFFFKLYAAHHRFLYKILKHRVVSLHLETISLVMNSTIHIIDFLAITILLPVASFKLKTTRCRVSKKFNHKKILSSFSKTFFCILFRFRVQFIFSSIKHYTNFILFFLELL